MLKLRMNKFLPILILCILADVVYSNSIVQIVEIQTYFSVLFLTTVMLVLQMFAAPIQAGFSDFYCRKKSLVVSLAFSFISLLCLISVKTPGWIPLIALCLGLILNSCFGNTVPIAWSALADDQERDLRFSLAITTSAYAIGYMLLAILTKTVPKGMTEEAWLWQDIIPPLALLGISVAFVWKFYRDTKDKKPVNARRATFAVLAHSELKSLIKEMKNPSTRFGMLAYFLWAASQYSPLLLLINYKIYANIVVIMMTGYLLGVAILGIYKKISDQKMIKAAFIITITSMTFYYAAAPLECDRHIILAISCFFYTLGNALLTPSIFSLFSKERAIHEQGKGFGLIVSADSAGFLVAIIAVEIFQSLELKLDYMILFSFIVFVVSWIPYKAYEKRRRNVRRTH